MSWPSCSGTQFDPQIVETFIACMQRGAEFVAAAPSGPSVMADLVPVETETEGGQSEPAAAAQFPRAEPAAWASTIDLAEMRDRIAATSARLKAKAFDAMVRGETALLARDGGAASGASSLTRSPRAATSRAWSTMRSPRKNVPAGVFQARIAPGAAEQAAMEGHRRVSPS